LAVRKRLIWGDCGIWPSTCAVLNFDEIRRLIKSGYAEPAIEWNEATERQWELAKHVVIAMAKTYIDNDISVVLEVFATPHDFPKWKRLFGDLPYTAVALVPELEVVLARNDQRQGVPKLKESDVTRNHEWSLGWKDVPKMTVIDNGIHNAADVAQEILDLSAQ
jgi:hypothetical protein